MQRATRPQSAPTPQVRKSPGPIVCSRQRLFADHLQQQRCLGVLDLTLSVQTSKSHMRTYIPAKSLNTKQTRRSEDRTTPRKAEKIRGAACFTRKELVSDAETVGSHLLSIELPSSTGRRKDFTFLVLLARAFPMLHQKCNGNFRAYKEGGADVTLGLRLYNPARTLWLATLCPGDWEWSHSTVAPPNFLERNRRF